MSKLSDALAELHANDLDLKAKVVTMTDYLKSIAGKLDSAVTNEDLASVTAISADLKDEAAQIAATLPASTPASPPSS